MNFYTEPLSDLLKHFDADPQKGLNEAQLEQAREKYGKNVLREQKKPSLLMRFLAQFKDTMIIILIIAAIISLLTAAEGSSACFSCCFCISTASVFCAIPPMNEPITACAFGSLNSGPRHVLSVYTVGMTFVPCTCTGALRTISRAFFPIIT